jgi:6-pyruvoyltetrahydropterin/6-carboxytetrahydropterin synthase
VEDKQQKENRLPGIFEVFVTSDFSAAHRLCDHPGPCARVHGHNFEVTATVRCRALDSGGMAIDFLDLRSALDEILGGLDHKELNSLPYFSEHPPTAENVARFVHAGLSSRLSGRGVEVARVTVKETPGFGATYWEA